MRYGALAAVGLTLLAVTLHAQQIDPAPANRKLTAVLADLAASSGSTTALTTESQRPRSVRDATQSRSSGERRSSSLARTIESGSEGLGTAKSRFDALMCASASLILKGSPSSAFR